MSQNDVPDGVNAVGLALLLLGLGCACFAMGFWFGLPGVLIVGAVVLTLIGSAIL